MHNILSANIRYNKLTKVANVTDSYFYYTKIIDSKTILEIYINFFNYNTSSISISNFAFNSTTGNVTGILTGTKTYNDSNNVKSTILISADLNVNVKTVIN